MYKKIWLVGFLGACSIFGSQYTSPTIDVEQMRIKFGTYMKVAEDARDKNITVFIGNTGVGKSTLINLLANFKMRIVSGGKIELEDKEEGAEVKEGTQSVTHCPQYFHSPEIGDMYDLPGFLDTGGTFEDILNASAICNILTNARAVRVVFVTSNAEIEEAARGRISLELDKAASMFGGFLRSNACGIIVNRVDRENVDSVGESTKIKKLLDQLDNISKVGNRFLLKKARIGDGQPFLEELRSDLLRAVSSVGQGVVRELNMSRVFSSETSSQIKGFFVNAMKNYMDGTKEYRYKGVIEEIAQVRRIDVPLSQVLESKAYEMWMGFKREFETTPEYGLLHDICTSQGREAFETFEPSFYHEHRTMVHVMQIKEKQLEKEAAEKAQQEAENQAIQSALEARAAKEQAELRQKEKEEAEALEKVARESAEAAQADATKSREEKEQAKQIAQRASENLDRATFDFKRTLAESEERLKKAETERRKSEEAAEEARKRTEVLEQTFKSQEEERTRELEDLRREMEMEKRRNEQQLENMKRQGDIRAQEQERQFKILQEDHRRDIEDVQRRHEFERNAMKARENENEGGGGFLGIIRDVIGHVLPPLMSKFTT